MEDRQPRRFLRQRSQRGTHGLVGRMVALGGEAITQREQQGASQLTAETRLFAINWRCYERRNGRSTNQTIILIVGANPNPNEIRTILDGQDTVV